MESVSLFTIFVRFRIRLFSTFRFFLFFFLFFLVISLRFHSERRLENAYNFMPLLYVRNVWVFFLHSWLIYRLKTFSLSVFHFSCCPLKAPPNTKNWNKHVQSIQCDKLDDCKKSLSLRWYVEWTKRNCVICFDNRPEYFRFSKNGKWCIYDRCICLHSRKPNQFGWNQNVQLYVIRNHVRRGNLLPRNEEITKTKRKIIKVDEARLNCGKQLEIFYFIVMFVILVE